MEEGYVVLELKTVSTMDPADFDAQVNGYIREGFFLKSISALPVANKIVYVASMVREAAVPEAVDEQNK